jgi:hypothetical protein
MRDQGGQAHAGSRLCVTMKERGQGRMSVVHRGGLWGWGSWAKLEASVLT